jgi:endoglucanase
MLEAPTEGAWSGLTVRDEYFPIIDHAGFHLVRIPIRWSAHVGPAPEFTINPEFLRRVDHVLTEARKRSLDVILDYHNDDDLMQDPAAHSDRFLAIWKQIAPHYQHASEHVWFELCNEPHGNLDAERWNRLAAQAIAVIRPTNPRRTIVVGPVKWNSVDALRWLELPESDHHLMVTVHFYEPFHFTHQGASWAEGSAAWLGTAWTGTPEEKAMIEGYFDRAESWGRAHRRPIFLGEFGSYEKADFDSRVRWTAFVRESAEQHGFSWAYWEFASSFGAWNPETQAWRQPLLHALIP